MKIYWSGMRGVLEAATTALLTELRAVAVAVTVENVNALLTAAANSVRQVLSRLLSAIGRAWYQLKSLMR